MNLLFVETKTTSVLLKHVNVCVYILLTRLNLTEINRLFNYIVNLKIDTYKIDYKYRRIVGLFSICLLLCLLNCVNRVCLFKCFLELQIKKKLHNNLRFWYTGLYTFMWQNLATIYINFIFYNNIFTKNSCALHSNPPANS